uniref:Uncharacterized protein n=1 Tax=Fagus sylvatica TaxID=28930 RepID=A0A2N9EW64_FAGSY
MDLHGLMKNNDPVDVFLQRVKESRDKLEAVDVHISDEEILHVVLKGLPTEFHSIRSAIRTRNDPISFNELRVLLSAEESSLKTNVDAPKDPPLMAMLSTGNRFPPNHNPPQFNNSSNRGRGRNNNGRVGHLALDCYHRMDYSYQGRHPPAKLVALASSNNLLNSAPNQNTSVSPWHNQNTPPWAHQNPPWAQQNPSSWQPLSTNQAPSTTTWVSDTGATDHFTPDLTNLNNPMDYPGSDQVSIGNGTAVAKASLHRAIVTAYGPEPGGEMPLEPRASWFSPKCVQAQQLTGHLGGSKSTSETMGDKLHRREGNSPDHQLRPLNDRSVIKEVGVQRQPGVIRLRGKHPRGSPSNQEAECRLGNALPPSVTPSGHSSTPPTAFLGTKGKLHQFPFPSSSFTATAPLELVHSDVWGPAPIVVVNTPTLLLSQEARLAESMDNRVRRGRENASSQCSSTRRYGAEVTHAILPGKARTTFNKRCRKVKEVGDLMTGEPATEAPVNGGRNYNGPKVAKFLVGLGGGRRRPPSGGARAASQKVTEACKGFLGPDGDWPSSAKAEGSLTARPTRRAGTKVGLSDPTVPSGRAVAQRIKVTLGITG